MNLLHTCDILIKFIPYIQLHEFEALLFSNNKGFEEYFTEEQSALTDAIVKEFENPENIILVPSMRHQNTF